MPSLIDFLKSVAYFDVLGAEDAERVAQEATELSVARGGILFLEGEECRGLYLVKSGRIRIFKSSSEGREQVLLIAGPRDSFNDVPVFDDGPNPASASALVESVVYLIPKGVLRSLIADCPAALSVIKVFAARLRHLTVVVEDLSFRSVIGRLSKLLLGLATAESESSPMPRLTQDEMASIVGSVRDVIGRALRHMEKTGAIRIEGQRILVIDTDKLRDMT